VFDDALTDLREQLVDGLTDREGAVLPIHVARGSPSPGPRRAIGAEG
jgi:hypothetical protein